MDCQEWLDTLTEKDQEPRRKSVKKEVVIYSVKCRGRDMARYLLQANGRYQFYCTERQAEFLWSEARLVGIEIWVTKECL